MSGDDNCHVALSDELERVEKVGFAFHIQMSRRLVGEKDLGIADQETGQTDSLLLPAGQASPAFGNGHVVAEWVAGNEVLDTRQP